MSEYIIMVMRNFFYIFTITILRYKSYILFNLTKFVYYPINLLIINPIYDYFNLHDFRFILDELVNKITFTNFFLSILICIFTIAFFKDFYRKHFIFSSTGLLQRISILWVQRKQVTIFVITLIIITFPIRILIRGFILCLLCKHNLLVMILAIPFTCYFSNLLKKYFFNIPIRKEDYLLFNDYVIKNVNLYTIFTIIVIQYICKAYLYYYICGIIIGIIIIIFILTENNKKFSSYLLLEANTNLSFSFICCLAVALQEASDTGFKLGVGEKKLTVENTSFPSNLYSGQSLLLTPETRSSMTPKLIRAKQAIIEGVEKFPILNMTNQQIENIKTKFEKELLNTNDITFRDLDLTIQPHSIYYKAEMNLIGLFSYIQPHGILIANLYNTTKYNGYSIFNIHPTTEYFHSHKLLQEFGNMLNPNTLSFIDFKHIIVLSDFEYTEESNIIKVPRYLDYNHKDPIQVLTKDSYYALSESIDNYSKDYPERNNAMLTAQNKVKNYWPRDTLIKDIFAMHVYSIFGVFTKNFERPILDPNHFFYDLSTKHSSKPLLVHKPSIAIRGEIEDFMNNDVINDSRHSLLARAKRIISENMKRNETANRLYALNIDEARIELLCLEKNPNGKYSTYSFIDITNMGIVSISTMENTKILKQTYNIFNSTDQETLKKFLNLANR